MKFYSIQSLILIDFVTLKFKRFDKIRHFFDEHIFKHSILIYKLCCESKFQVKITLSTTVIFCFFHWYFSDKVIVKYLSIPLHNQINSTVLEYRRNELKIVVLTDLHAGACVYEKQISNVVDKVNELNADAVFIIGSLLFIFNFFTLLIKIFEIFDKYNHLVFKYFFTFIQS